MKNRLPQFCFRLLFIVIASLVLTQIALAQKSGDETTSDEFGRSRDITSDIKSGDTVMQFPARQKSTYKQKRIIPRPNRLKTIPKGTVVTEEWGRLGVTFWRGEPDTKAADGETARLLVQKNGRPQSLTPVRMAADTVFSAGDMVRLSIESPRAGYLYIIDREVLDDGSLGEPYMIFPTKSARGGENYVKPGQVVDIPGPEDAQPFFELEPKDKRWRGELLTIIVSPTKLTGITVPPSPAPIAPALVKAWEEKYLNEAVEFEQEGTAGKAYTKSEKEAAAGTTRQLTQKDPYPQTMYKVKMKPREPMMINLNLAINK